MTKILIVDDDQLMTRMYEKVFRFDGYDVELASTGQEALDKLKLSKPTLILMDVMMPVMNGLEALEHIKANPELMSIPVIMLTNLAGQQDAESALARGAVKYIVKSEYDPKQISEMVKEVLKDYARNAVPIPSPQLVG